MPSQVLLWPLPSHFVSFSLSLSILRRFMASPIMEAARRDQLSCFPAPYLFQSLTCANSYAAPDLYSRGKKKSQILWICLISATKRLLEVSLCWDAYKKVWAWSSKLICCQIELNNFLLLSCLAASSLGGGTSGLELALQDLWGSGCFILCDCGALVWPCQASIPVWVLPLSWNRPGLESTAEIFTPTCSFLSNPWTI